MKNARSLCLRYALPAILLLFFLMFLSCPITSRNEQRWTSLGYVSTGAAGEPWQGYYGNSITIDPSDHKPIVAVNDQGRVRVQKWVNGTTWTDLGNPNSGTANMPSVAVDPSDSKPIVIFYEGSGGRARVMKWSGGTSWTDLGYVSPSEAHEPRIIIDPSDNKPVVVYSEFVGGSYNFVQVLKWSDGTNWTDMGYPSPVGGLHPAIAIDLSDNKPIVAFTAGSHDYVQVVKWSSGTTWTDMGTPRPSEGDSPALAICPLDNKPVVALFQGGAYVYKWASGTAWTDLGCAILPGGSPDIALRADGTPVVVCTHQGWSGQVQVKHWAGSKQWSSMGYPSTGEAAHTSIAIDPSNNATFVLFTDGEYGWRAKVMRYDP